MDAGDASRRLGDLLALAAGDLAPLREAIDELDREDAGELLLAAVDAAALARSSACSGERQTALIVWMRSPSTARRSTVEKPRRAGR